MVIPLLEAAKSGDLNTVKSQNISDSVVDPDGSNCLHYAARGGSLEVLQYLVTTHGLNPTVRNNIGSTPLHDAAATGNLHVLKWLLEHSETKVDDQDGAGATVTHLAASYGHTQTLTWLLDETNCDVLKKSNSGAIPLHFAAEGGKMECVKILLAESPRSSNTQMNNGSTPVFLACQQGHLEVSKFLSQKNGTPKIHTFDGMSPLHAAAQMGHLPVVKWLIKDEGLSPNERDFEGATPLHYAANHGHSNVIQWLLKEGGARIILDNLGGTPLHSAAQVGQNDAVHTLLKNGCNKDITDNEGLTAEELAEKCGQSRTAAILRGEIAHEPPNLPSNSPKIAPQKLSNSVSSKVSNSSSAVGVSSRTFSVGHPEHKSNPLRHSHHSETAVLAPEEIRHSQAQHLLVCNSSETGEREYCPFAGKPALLHTAHQPTSSSVFESTTVYADSLNGHHHSSNESTIEASLSRPKQNGSSESQHQLEKESFPEINEPAAVGLNRSVFKVNTDHKNLATQPVSSPSFVKMNGNSSKFQASNASSAQGSAKSLIQISHKNVTIISTNKEGSTSSKFVTTPLRKSDHLSGMSSVSAKKNDASFMSDLSQRFETEASVSKKRPSPLPAVIPSGMSSVSTRKNDTNFMSDLSQRFETEASNNKIRPSPLPVVIPSKNSTQTFQSSSHVQKQTTALGQKQVADSTASSLMPPPTVILNGHAEDHSLSNGHSRSSSPSTPPAPPPPPPPPPTDSPAIKPVKVIPDASYTGRPKNFSTQSSLVNGTSSPVSPRTYALTPEQQKQDLIAAIHAVVTSGSPSDSLRKSRGPPGGGAKEVFSSKRGSSGSNTPTGLDSQSLPPPPATNQFDAKNFLDKVAMTDSSGNAIPDWRRHMMAKTMAEKAHAEYLEKKKVDDYEARFKGMPSWKRALIEKKEGK